jgi:hypothetical protein
MFQPCLRTSGAITILSLTLVSQGLLSAVSPPDRPEIAFRVRAYAERKIDTETLRRVVEVADDLLSRAGVAGIWRLCDTAASCPLVESRVREIVVILSTRSDPKRRGRCGVAALGDQESTGTVTVSVPCVEEVGTRLQRQLATRTHPNLAVARHDDIVGAVVAHEIGHVLGLPHTPAGLMRARLEPGEIMALRQHTLAFSPQESTAMHLALLRARMDPALKTARR